MDLTPGAHARVRRDGAGEPVGMYEVPRDGSPLVIRDLAPGSYEADDGCGKTHRFHVTLGEEVVEISGRSVPKDEILPDARSVPGAAGSGVAVETGPEQIHAPGSEEAQAVREAAAALEDEPEPETEAVMGWKH